MIEDAELMSDSEEQDFLDTPVAYVFPMLEINEDFEKLLDELVSEHYKHLSKSKIIRLKQEDF